MNDLSSQSDMKLSRSSASVSLSADGTEADSPEIIVDMIILSLCPDKLFICDTMSRVCPFIIFSNLQLKLPTSATSIQLSFKLVASSPSLPWISLDTFPPPQIKSDSASRPISLRCIRKIVGVLSSSTSGSWWFTSSTRSPESISYDWSKITLET